MTEAERIATKLSKDFTRLDQLVQGNGTKEGSIVARLREIEIHQETTDKRLIIVESFPCKDGCLFEYHKEKEDQVEDKTKNNRRGDIANYIQIAMLAVAIVMMYISMTGGPK